MIPCPVTLTLTLVRWILARLASTTHRVIGSGDYVMSEDTLSRADTVSLIGNLCPNCHLPACPGTCDLDTVDLSRLACHHCGVATCEDVSHDSDTYMGSGCLRCLNSRCLGDCAQRANLALLEAELTVLGYPTPPRPVLSISLDEPCDEGLGWTVGESSYVGLVPSREGR